MAQTRIRIGEQLALSTTARSLMITDGSNKPSYVAPTTGADTIFFWDDSATNWAQLTIGTNLSITGTTLNASAGAGGYAEVQEEGTPLTARTKLNFVGGGFTAADDGANTRTNVTLASQLNTFAAYNTNGLFTQTAAGTYTGRTITGTASRITVTNGDGVSGNPTIDINTSYVGQSTITTLGTITTGVWTGTAIAAANGGTGQTTYAVGDLLAANTTSTLSRVAAVATGSVLKSAGTSTLPVWGTLASTDLTNSANIALLNGTQTISGTYTFSNNITMNGTPSANTDVVTVGYVNNLLQGLDPKASVRVATTAILTASAQTSSTITLGGTTLTIDSISMANGDRVLVKDSVTGGSGGTFNNGIYTVGGIGSSVVLTRATDMDAWTEVPSAFVFVEVGTVNADTGWVCTADQGGTLGTTAITWVKFANAAVSAIDGAGAANKIAVWSDADTLGYNNNFTINTGSGFATMGTATQATNTILTTQGTGTGNTTFGLTHNNSSAAAVFQVADDGTISLGTSTATTINKTTFIPSGSYTFSTGNNIITFSVNGSGGKTAFSAAATTNSGPVVEFGTSTTQTLSSSNQTLMQMVSSYAPTTGTGTWIGFNVTPTVNQTGGANGITRSIYINPTLTAAADFRGLEINVSSSHYALYTASGRVRFDIGSDATGDLLTRGSSGYLQRIATGTSSQVLIGGTTPSFGAIPYSVTIAYLESSTSTTIDLDAGTTVKDRDGSNIAFTLPTNLDMLEVYRNGILQARTGTGTTRDYSLNSGTNEITFTTALTADEIVMFRKLV